MTILFRGIFLALCFAIITPFAIAASGNITETKVIVTEAIPGMKCDFIPSASWAKEWDSLPANRKYSCTIKPGFGSVMDILGGLIKYATFIVALIGVLMLVVSGIQYSLAGFDKESAGKAKGRIVKVLWGIILLFLTGLILNSVAPWIYK